MMRLLLIPLVPVALFSIAGAAIVLAPICLWRRTWAVAAREYCWGLTNVLGFALVIGLRLWRAE